MTGKIVLIHNTTHYLKLHYRELIEAFIDRGWMVHCVAPLDEATSDLETMGVTCIGLEVSRRGMNPLRELGSLAALCRILKRERPTCVLNFSIKPAIYGSLAAKFAGVRRICSMITGLGYVFLGGGSLRAILSSFVRLAYKMALSANYRVFFQNPDDCDFFVTRGVIGREKSVVLPGTGIDTKHFSPRRAVVGESRPGIGFLVVARLLSDKGLREFVEAARTLKARFGGVRCALLGPYDDNPSAIGAREVQAWVDRGDIFYLGETDDVASVIADYDVFVLPSYREGLPRSTLEAMAMGKPVITTDVPGCRETVVEGANGFLVPPRDAAALAAAMSRFVENPALIESMGSVSRDLAVQKFDVHAVNRLIVHAVCDGL